jgi:hypothetical protein
MRLPSWLAKLAAWRLWRSRQQQTSELPPTTPAEETQSAQAQEQSEPIGDDTMSTTETDQVVLEGDRVIHNFLVGGPGGTAEFQGETTLGRFVGYLAEQLQGHQARSLGLAPSGMVLRDIYQRGNMYVFLVEVAPGPRTMEWIRGDSPAAYGSDATYRDVTISLPWQYFFVSIYTNGWLGNLNSVYFRNEPLRSLNDPLYNPHFYNCSINAYGAWCWICVQGYQRQKPADTSLLEFVNDFVAWFWGSGFNRSSEHNEQEGSFWGRDRRTIGDARVQTIEAWEAATKVEGTFALSVPWIDSGYVPDDIYQQLTARANVWHPATSAEMAQAVKACRQQERRKS